MNKNHVAELSKISIINLVELGLYSLAAVELAACQSPASSRPTTPPPTPTLDSQSASSPIINSDFPNMIPNQIKDFDQTGAEIGAHWKSSYGQYEIRVPGTIYDPKEGSATLTAEPEFWSLFPYLPLFYRINPPAGDFNIEMKMAYRDGQISLLAGIGKPEEPAPVEGYYGTIPSSIASQRNTMVMSWNNTTHIQQILLNGRNILSQLKRYIPSPNLVPRPNGA